MIEGVTIADMQDSLDLRVEAVEKFVKYKTLLDSGCLWDGQIFELVEMEELERDHRGSALPALKYREKIDEERKAAENRPKNDRIVM